MSADFFKGKIIAIATGIVAVLVVLGVYMYTRYLDMATVEAVSQNYYFLVSDSTHIEASTHEIILDGGAGYVLESNGTEYVTVSSYLSSHEAEMVQKGLDRQTRIIALRVDNLYFKTKEEKRNSAKIKAAFQSLSDCIEVLSKETARLEKGGTQESCKRILETLKKQFVFLGREYNSVFLSYGQLCDRTAVQLEKLLNTTIFVSDLRHLQCDLCNSYVSLANEFSL